MYRSRERVDALAPQLADAGVPARGCVAERRGCEALASALGAAADAQGAVEDGRGVPALAERVWSMHTDRAGCRHFADGLDA